MNSITKKLVSGISALSMLIPLYSAMPVTADDSNPTPAPSVTRTLSVKFMGRGATPQETSPGEAKLNAEDLDQSNPDKQEFWVGVSVDKVDDLDLFKNGIYSLELAFEYDPSFVIPYYSSGTAESDWLAEIEKGNLKSSGDAAFNEAAWWDQDKYEIISVMETDIDVEADSGVTVDREDKDKVAERKAAGWKMCTVCVNYKPDVTFSNARFNGLADDGEKFLLKLPFKVKKVPGENDTNKNPKVLSLVRGPETMDIGSGADGKTPHSTWIKTVTDWTDQSNMKTLFKDSGDISLFGAGNVIEDIDPYKPETTPGPDATPVPTLEPLSDLSQTKDLLEESFEDGKTLYYLSVPNEYDTIQFKITYPDTPTVKVHYTDDPTDADITVTETDDGKQTTADIPLKEINRDTANGGEEDGYNNIISISDDTTTYEIHVRRLLKPQVVLNPGNSPYGQIERMAAKYLPADQQSQAWDEAKIQQAKEAFDKSDVAHGNLTYGDGFVPNDAITKVKYTEKAWRSYDKNYDKDEYAIFVYEKSKFVDPGISVYNEFGEKEENPQFDREFIVKKMSVGTPDYSANLDNLDLSVANGDNSTVFSLVGNIIRPDKYIMKYSYTFANNQGVGETITLNRPVIVLSKRGDIQLTTDPSFNTNDGKTFANTYSAWGGTSANSLFAFRVCDLQTTTDASVNTNDYKQIIADLGKYSTFPYDQFYVELPTN